MQVCLLTNESEGSTHGGGSQRTNMLLNSLKSSLGEGDDLEVIRVEFGSLDLLKSNTVKFLPFANDIEFSLHLVELMHSLTPLLTRILEKAVEADVIVLDSCYLSPLVMKVFEKYPEKRVIYLSHNYEIELKTEIAELLHWPTTSRDLYLAFLRQMESEIVSHSSLTIACSPDDVQALQQFTQNKIVLVPNGANPRARTNQSKEEICRYLGCDNYVLYVASGHPPNIYGFLEGIGQDLGFVPPNKRVAIVGSASIYIEREIRGTKYEETFANRASCISDADDNLLNGLYQHSAAILLPIFTGGGTSIKSVEALLSDRKVIATSFAFRGFSLDIRHSDGVKITDTPGDFRLAARNALTQNEATPHNRENVDNYTWDAIQVLAIEIFRDYFSNLERCER